MSHKEYSRWHTTKSIINEKERPAFNEKEIWFANIGSNIGCEEDGKGKTFLRPVIILRKFSKEACLAVPLTRSFRVGVFYYNFSFSEGPISTAILSQLRLIDSKRLNYRAGTIGKNDFVELKEKLRRLLA